MLPIFDQLRSITPLSTCVRLLLSLLCGGIVGIERSYKNRPAGFRTHMLVCEGSTMASMIGLYLYLNLQLPTDLSRMGAQVIAGLGFIGAGTIIVTKKKSIKGLTTAAGLWTTGIIGLAIGAGFYEGAIIATFLILLAETWFAKLGTRIQHVEHFRLRVTYYHKASLDQVMRYCKDHRLAITNLQITGTSEAEDGSTLYHGVITLRTTRTITLEELFGHIKTIEGVYTVEGEIIE